MRRGGALIWLLELLRTAVGNSRNQIANGFFERAERRASDAPAGLPQARRRPAEKTGAGFIM
ncbi:hypothetical protein CN643_07685 [Parageobacillus yumthangensis]|nr:hypothetical protein CN643_07685 [Parageobacillus yumthangensis]